MSRPRPSRRRPSRRRAGVAVLSALAAGALLAGCDSDNSIAAQAKEGSDKGYVAADGRSEIIPAAKRAEPVTLTGTTLDGQSWASTEHRDKVLVVNVWASWCGPCDKEAPELVKVAGDPGVSTLANFVGINLREQPAAGKAQVAAWKLPYPNLSDPGGQSILALQGKAAAMPSTLLLDREGRIAARTLGPVTESTLTGMIEDVAAGDAGS